MDNSTMTRDHTGGGGSQGGGLFEQIQRGRNLHALEKLGPHCAMDIPFRGYLKIFTPMGFPANAAGHFHLPE